MSDPHTAGSVSHALMVGSGLMAEIFFLFRIFAVQFVNFFVFFSVRLATTTHVVLRIQSTFPCLLISLQKYENKPTPNKKPKTLHLHDFYFLFLSHLQVAAKFFSSFFIIISTET